MYEYESQQCNFARRKGICDIHLGSWGLSVNHKLQPWTCPPNRFCSYITEFLVRISSHLKLLFFIIHTYIHTYIYICLYTCVNHCMFNKWSICLWLVKSPISYVIQAWNHHFWSHQNPPQIVSFKSWLPTCGSKWCPLSPQYPVYIYINIYIYQYLYIYICINTYIYI